MTDQEFKRLTRPELIDIIYQFQLQVDQLTEKNQELERQLADKRLRLNTVGNIAEAALEMNDCFRNAQKAAEQYLEEIKALREEAEAERQRILAKAEVEASEIIAGAKKNPSNDNSAIEAILKEYLHNHSENG